VERVTPIHVLEYTFRCQGAFLLVDASGKRLWFFKYGNNNADIDRMMESMKGRADEMVKFLLARAKGVRG